MSNPMPRTLIRGLQTRWYSAFESACHSIGCEAHFEVHAEWRRSSNALINRHSIALACSMHASEGACEQRAIQVVADLAIDPRWDLELHIDQRREVQINRFLQTASNCENLLICTLNSNVSRQFNAQVSKCRSIGC